jgi:hypothetical protein
MSGPGFLPITLVDDNGDTQLGVTVDGTPYPIMPDTLIYEQLPYTKKTHQYWDNLYDSNGKPLARFPLPTEGTSVYYSIGNRNQRQDIKNDLGNGKYFIINSDGNYDKPRIRIYNDADIATSGGRKRKQSKYSSKKRSIKSRRRRNSRKRRYSRRR